MPARLLAALAALSGTALAVLSGTALAAPPGQTPPFPPVPVTAAPTVGAEPSDAAPTHVGYRLELALVDLTCAGVLGLGVALDSDELATTGGLSLVFAAPIAHAVLGNPRSSGLSFAARAGMPVLGLLGGLGTGALLYGGDADRVAGLGATSMMVGGIVGLALDYGFLARRPLRAERPARTLAVAPTDGGAVVGLAGRF